MKPLKLSIAPTILLSVVLFVSCQKEVGFRLTDNDNPAVGTYLSKVIFLDTLLLPGSDTISKSFFEYDGINRLAKIITYQKASLGVDTIIAHFLYQEGGDLPYLVVEEGSYSSPTGSFTSFVDSTFLSYNGNLVKTDSLIISSFPGNVHSYTIVHNSQISGNTVKDYEKWYSYSGGLLTMTNFDSAFYTVNRNAENLFSSTYISGTIQYHQNITVSYDNKVNPYGVIIKFRYPNYYGRSFAGGWEIGGSNPLQMQYQNFSAPFSGSCQFTYKYRSDGFPISSTYFQSDGANAENKILYFYRILR